MSSEAAEWRVWLDAKFLAPPASQAVPNAQKTVLAAGQWDGAQLTAFTPKEWAKLGTTWKAFEAATRAGASADFKSLEITFKRDKRNVIQYAELTSKEGLVPSAILAPELGRKFETTIGEVLLIAVPSRSKAYVFPEFGGDIAKFSDLVWDAYRETPYPVSVEVFEWRKGILKAVGSFEH